ncbi:MAG: copper homeostasis protein CutC [Anaerorhabdus sp.]
MINNIKLEICCGTIDDVLVAKEFDIDRIELNSALKLGGLTPSLATFLSAKRITNIPILCMVRPRGAGFNYSHSQFEIMLEDAEILLKNGADGIVFGFLNDDNTINIEWTKKMTDLIKKYSKEAVFHKAFDLTPDLFKACETLIDCKVDRILTSGGNFESLNEGLDNLNKLVNNYSDNIEILVCGGIRGHNVVNVINSTECTQVHAAAKIELNDNGNYFAVSKKNIESIIKALNTL